MTKAICPVCGEEFEILCANQKYCSKKCRCIRASRKYYHAHKEKIQLYYSARKEQNRVAALRYCATHREKCRIDTRRYYSEHKEQVNMTARENRRVMREWVAGIKAELKCSVCHEARSICLDFHHVDSSTKEKSISGLLDANKSKEQVANEIAKCIVLCKNCHAVVHEEQRIRAGSMRSSV